MVKKIRVIEEEPTIETLDDQSYRRQMLDYQKAIDWKLWEMLKIMQSMVVVDVDEDEDNDSMTEEGRPRKPEPKGYAVIIDDDGLPTSR
jgi:hypothetical protein